MQSSKLRLEGAIMLHFQMRIFLVLGVLFGTSLKRQGIVRFGLFWQKIGVTISRRYAAGECAHAQACRHEGGKRM